MGGLIGAFNPLPDFLNFSNFRYHIFYQSCHISQRGFPGLTYHNFGYHWWSCLGIWPPPTLFFFSLFGIYFFYLPQPTDSDFTNGHWRSFWAFCTCFIRSYVAQLLYPPVVSHITPRCLSQECEEDDINCVTPSTCDRRHSTWTMSIQMVSLFSISISYLSSVCVMRIWCLSRKSYRVTHLVIYKSGFPIL